ncbi:DNA starvation/stationary phase protection protein [Fulvivirga sp. RKSG066]|uniref:Dps family protein n=1 Tax=Fulvivirga aurantia TaxID=2529383 RepID=UPI0012BC0883|nr:DNA starvation/stationary phase protection protein [Fulvivirga aurantia]MTI23020.1 DNA starvation/stationary phase protection protein [Fulvivirga aurantia]
MKNTELIDKLNVLLSDYQIYYQNLRGFHWNIQGKHFFQLHEKFEELYLDTAAKVDDIAERILTIDGKPLHSFEDYVSTSTIKAKKNVHDGEGAVSGIKSDLEELVKLQTEIKDMAGEAGDNATEDLMIGYNEFQQKVHWMMKAWLK